MDVISYQDFDLQIQRVGDEYRAQVLNSPKGQAATSFTLPFTPEGLEIFLLKVGRTRHINRAIDSPAVKAAKEFGGALFGSVFKDQVRDCLLGSLGVVDEKGFGLRVRLRLTDVPELADIPWEYLYNPHDDFLTLSNITPLVRYLDFQDSVQPLEVTPPLRMLVMISSPTDLAKLDVDREWSNVRTALAKLERWGLVTVDRVEGNLAALQQRLQTSQYHIFHYIGHGGFDQHNQTGVLALEGLNKLSRNVSGEDLGRILRDHRSMRIAVLNACEGARADTRDPFAGTAQSLIKKRLPAVVAMQFEISDEAAITFAEAFYTAVAVGYPVDAALAEARKAIFAHGNGLEWGTPVLYLRAADGRIFTVEQTRELRKRIRVAQLIEDADKAIARQDWWSATTTLNAALTLDSANEDAKRRLHQVLQQQEPNLQSRVSDVLGGGEPVDPPSQENPVSTSQPVRPASREDAHVGSRERITAPIRDEASRTVHRRQGPIENFARMAITNLRDNRRIQIATIMVVVVVLIGLLIWWVLTVPLFAPANANFSTKPTGKESDVQPKPSPKMASVSKGEFMMGSDIGTDERPAHLVKVDPFFIDLYEVSREDYQKFLRATKRNSPPDWSGTDYPPGTERQPVTGVSWTDATAYAQWRSTQEGGTYRLPTEEQWEYAARGTDGRLYPWGKKWQDGLANAASKYTGFTPVGELKGTSPVGAFDMAGNAWEWTRSEFLKYPRSKEADARTSKRIVIRGGAYDSDPKYATTTYRGYAPPEGGDYSKTGFRCVRELGR